MRQSLGLGGVGLLAIVCCAGLPLIVAAGLGAATVTLVGGFMAGAIALAAAVFLVLRVRRRSLRADKPVLPAPREGLRSVNRAAPARARATTTKE